MWCPCTVSLQGMLLCSGEVSLRNIRALRRTSAQHPMHLRIFSWFQASYLSCWIRYACTLQSFALAEKWLQFSTYCVLPLVELLNLCSQWQLCELGWAGLQCRCCKVFAAHAVVRLCAATCQQHADSKLVDVLAVLTVEHLLVCTPWPIEVVPSVSRNCKMHCVSPSGLFFLWV